MGHLGNANGEIDVYCIRILQNINMFIFDNKVMYFFTSSYNREYQVVGSCISPRNIKNLHVVMPCICPTTIILQGGYHFTFTTSSTLLNLVSISSRPPPLYAYWSSASSYFPHPTKYCWNSLPIDSRSSLA